MDTDELAFEYSRFDTDTRDPIAPQFTGKWKDRAALKWDTTLISFNKIRLLWNHNIHAETLNTGIVKTTGWEWKFGVDLGRVELLHHHHSRHVLDERVEYPTYGKRINQFPVEDSVMVRLKFLTREK